MNKKMILILILLFSVSLFSVFAESFGETRLGIGFGVPNTVLMFQTGAYDIKVGYDFTEGSEYFFLNGSYMVINSRPINEIFSGTLGIGLFGKISFGEEDENDFIGGLNIPITGEVALLDGFLELFATVAPAVELFPKPIFTTRAVSWWLGFSIMLD
jgi:hypothetical protein